MKQDAERITRKKLGAPPIMGLGKWKRRLLIGALYPFPRDRARRIYHWVEGRRVARQLRDADAVFVSLPKTGRTWLRVMLWRFYQQRFGLPDDSHRDLENYCGRQAGIPFMLFTHDNHLRYYLKEVDPTVRYQGKKVILMVRDPRDGAVSMFFQWMYRTENSKKFFSAHGDREYSIGEFVLGDQGQRGIIHRRIKVLNRWSEAIPRLSDVLVLRYEDLHHDPVEWLGKVLEFLGTPGSEEEIREAVSFASFEKMRAREASVDGSVPSRLRPGRPGDTNTFKARRGKVGGYKDYFDQEEIERLDAIVERRLNPIFGY